MGEASGQVEAFAGVELAGDQAGELPAGVERSPATRRKGAGVEASED